MKQRNRVIAAMCALVLAPATASAQQQGAPVAEEQSWLRDRRYAEGIGIRIGDFELHPGAGAEFGYDSNFFHRAPEESPVGALRLRITPSFSISSLGAQRRDAGGGRPDVEFRGSVALTYNEFFPVSGPAADRASMVQNRNISGDLDLGLGILPGRTWSGLLSAGVSRAITPTNEGLPGNSYRRVLPRAGADLIFTPGGGLLDWRLGYQFSGMFFESTAFTNLTNLQHQISTRGRWRFLPRTALLYDARFAFINYTNPTTKTGSRPLRVQIGVNGLITPSFGLLAMVGWGASFYQPATPLQYDFNSVIGRVEAKWYLTPNPSLSAAETSNSMSSVAVGFSRDFYDNFFGTYVERDRGYVNFSYFFGGSFLLVVDGGAGPAVYPPIPSLNLAQSFTDIRIDGSLFGEYRIKDMLGINATFKYDQNLSNVAVQATPTATPDYLKWQEIQAYLGVRWFM